MFNRKRIAVLLVAMLALVLGMVSYGSVSAQGTTPTPETPSQEWGPMNDVGKMRMAHGRGAFPGGYNQEDLAAALGIEVEALRAAQETASAEALQQAVQQGLITQEQADAFSARGIPKFLHSGRGLPAAAGIDHEALLADALGITVEQLQAAYDTAFTTRLDRAVTDGSITQEQADLVRGQHALAGSASFQSSMRSAYETAVQQAVTEGVITQAQANQILENNAGMNFFGRKGFGGFHGRGFGRPGGSFPPTEPADGNQ